MQLLKNGGYLGKFAAEQMVPEFAMAVKALPKGGYSKILQKLNLVTM